MQILRFRSSRVLSRTSEVGTISGSGGGGDCADVEALLLQAAAFRRGSRRPPQQAKSARSKCCHRFPHTMVTLTSVLPASPHDAPFAVGLSG